MKQLNPEHIHRLLELINTSPYLELLSFRLSDIGSGYATVEVELDSKHLQAYQFVHGGVFAGLIDTATFWSVYCDVPDETAGMTSVDLKLNYLAAARSGRLQARGRQIKLGRTLGYAEAEVTNTEGKLLAHGTSTLMVLPGKGLVTETPLPPKFID